VLIEVVDLVLVILSGEAVVDVLLVSAKLFRTGKITKNEY